MGYALFSRVRPEKKQAVYSLPIYSLVVKFFLANKVGMYSKQVQVSFIFHKQFQQLLLAMQYRLLLTADLE